MVSWAFVITPSEAKKLSKWEETAFPLPPGNTVSSLFIGVLWKLGCHLHFVLLEKVLQIIMILKLIISSIVNAILIWPVSRKKKNSKQGWRLIYLISHQTQIKISASHVLLDYFIGFKLFQLFIHMFSLTICHRDSGPYYPKCGNCWSSGVVVSKFWYKNGLFAWCLCYCMEEWINKSIQGTDRKGCYSLISSMGPPLALGCFLITVFPSPEIV